jgi:hypothetical protein
VYSIIAAAAKVGKDVKVEYYENGKIKSFTTSRRADRVRWTPGTAIRRQLKQRMI